MNGWKPHAKPIAMRYEKKYDTNEHCFRELIQASVETAYDDDE